MKNTKFVEDVQPTLGTHLRDGRIWTYYCTHHLPLAVGVWIEQTWKHWGLF